MTESHNLSYHDNINTIIDHLAPGTSLIANSKPVADDWTVCTNDEAQRHGHDIRSVAYGNNRPHSLVDHWQYTVG
jgi:hypothetical protein